MNTNNAFNTRRGGSFSPRRRNSHGDGNDMGGRASSNTMNSTTSNSNSGMKFYQSMNFSTAAASTSSAALGHRQTYNGMAGGVGSSVGGPTSKYDNVSQRAQRELYNIPFNFASHQPQFRSALIDAPGTAPFRIMLKKLLKKLILCLIDVTTAMLLFFTLITI